MTGFSFRLLHTDGVPRAGEITTPRGKIRTPAFMPVGTRHAQGRALARGAEPAPTSCSPTPIT